MYVIGNEILWADTLWYPLVKTLLISTIYKWRGLCVSESDKLTLNLCPINLRINAMGLPL